MIDATKLVAAVPQSMKVAASAVAVAEPITLEQARDHLRVIGTDEDAYIQGLITVAREMAENRTNRTIAQRLRSATFANWRGEMVLLKPPFVSIESVVYFDDAGVEQVLPADEYYVGTGTGLAVVEFANAHTLPTLYRRRHPITVTYLAGYAPGEVPQPLIQWMRLVIGTLYENRETMSAGVQLYEMPANFMSWLTQPYMVYE